MKKISKNEYEKLIQSIEYQSGKIFIMEKISIDEKSMKKSIEYFQSIN